jgi:PPM family protein phosphatase
MQIRAAAASEVGHRRSGNEDSYLCQDRLFAVADGLGGHAGGEVASAITIEALAELDGSLDELDKAGERLAQAVWAGNDAVLRRAAEDSALEGMGTTVTAAAVIDGQVVLAHVGDSRAYLLREGRLERLTDDHTPVEEAVRAGQITAEAARTHPYRNMLSRAVGLDEEVDVDVVAPQPLQPGDRLLLCSDGLSGPVDDPQIGAVLARSDDPDEACRELVQAALDGGGPDNITVVVVFTD